MNTESRPSEGSFMQRWILANFFGWFLGFVLVVVLSILWDVFGGGAQFMIGVGMGAGVGLGQAFAARRWLDRPKLWAGASVLGMGGLFVVADTLHALGLSFPYSLPLYVAVGGLLAGVLQLPLLRPHADRRYWWVAASCIGWSVPAGLLMLNDSQLVPEVWGMTAFLATLGLGGILLGAVTGATLVRIRRREDS